MTIRSQRGDDPAARGLMRIDFRTGDGPGITIPTVLIRLSDGNRLKGVLAASQRVSVGLLADPGVYSGADPEGCLTLCVGSGKWVYRDRALGSGCRTESAYGAEHRR